MKNVIKKKKPISLKLIIYLLDYTRVIIPIYITYVYYYLLEHPRDVFQYIKLKITSR